MPHTKLPVSWPHLTGDVRQTWPGKRWWQKPGPWCKTKARFGRRGAMLLLLGLTYVVIGYGVVTRPVPVIPGAYHLTVEPQIRGLVWAFTGLIAAGYAFVRHDDGLMHKLAWWRTDAPGWVALYLMPAVRITSYAGSWFMWEITDRAAEPPVGDPMAWYQAAIHIPFIAAVVICSGWLENPRRGDCS